MIFLQAAKTVDMSEIGAYGGSLTMFLICMKR